MSHPLLTAPIGASLLRLAGPITGLMFVQIGVGIAEDVEPRLDRAPADALAMIAFTSGTTGRPKGAMLSRGNLLAGAVVVETVYSWPGLGTYAYNSILQSDYNAIMAFTLFTGSVFIAVNLLVDVLQAVLDPRGR